MQATRKDLEDGVGEATTLDVISENIPHHQQQKEFGEDLVSRLKGNYERSQPLNVSQEP